jgi:hypothetical protein
MPPKPTSTDTVVAAHGSRSQEHDEVWRAGDSSGTLAGCTRTSCWPWRNEAFAPTGWFLRSAGIDLMIGRREGYRLWDLDGREPIDVHLNGGVYNL